MNITFAPINIINSTGVVKIFIFGIILYLSCDKSITFNNLKNSSTVSFLIILFNNRTNLNVIFINMIFIIFIYPNIII